MSTAAVETSNLVKTYREPLKRRTAQALRGVSVRIERGVIFGLLGQNGAGKTTFTKILLSLVQPTSGTAQVLGGSPADPAIRRRIGYLPEQMSLPEMLKAPSLLRLMGRYYGMERAVLERRIPEVLEQVGLAGNRKPIEAYSKGMRQRLGLAQALLNDPELMFLDEPEPLVTTNAIFEDEETMSDWTNASKEWQAQQAAITVDGQPVVPLWHSNQFPGDVELIVEPRQINEERHELALSVSKDGKGAHNGYIFLYQAGRKSEDGKPATILKIIRAGEPVAERVLAGNAIRDLSSLSVRRVGPFVVGKINGKPELVYHDDKPLEGAKIAYYAKGVEVRAESSRIVSDHFLNELFSSAPVRWRTAGYAIAEVTNRWQCDPRWSFFSLKNDLQFKDKGGTAVLWNKGLYPGDVMLEFYVGNKMEAERGQPYYSYSRDINVTLCGDGQDLTKGYTLMWGGHGNKATYLYRNGVEVKRVEGTIPNEQRLVHRAWMSVRVEKRGNKISFHADRLPGHAPIHLVYEDPDPLEGNRVAIWTYHHAIMLSRVRITGEGGTVQESPDLEFLAPKTIYEP